MKNRTIYQVAEILKKRYGYSDTLLELFLDHEAIFTLETLIGQGPNECGGENSETWLEYKRLTRNFSIDLIGGRFGAYSNFLQDAESLGIDGVKAFKHFSRASGYYGTDMSGNEELERGAEMAECFAVRGRQYISRPGG